MAKYYKFNKNLPKPSILDGISSMADFRSLKERYAELLEGQEADYRAILSDWLAIGDDFQKSLDRANSELTEKA